jgi:hypothetical protein
MHTGLRQRPGAAWWHVSGQNLKTHGFATLEANALNSWEMVMGLKKFLRLLIIEVLPGR